MPEEPAGDSVGGAWREISDSHRARWMLFVDGENFAIRARKVAENTGLRLQPGPFYSRDIFVWLPRYRGHNNLYEYDVPLALQPRAVRAYYYTSVVGDEQKLTSIKEALWELGFQPTVFKKTTPDKKAKGVDISLATDFLGGAYRDNYDVAVLIAGDGDYVPLVEEVKRLGKLVYVAFFEGDKSAAGLSPELRLASDVFASNFERFFNMSWKSYQPNG